MKKQKVAIWLVITFITGLFVIGVITSANKSAQNVDVVTLEGKLFYSIEEHEKGLGPNGLIVGTWSISFCPNNTYGWDHSDRISGGSYIYNVKTGVLEDTERAIRGVYNPRSRILLWADVEYKEQWLLFPYKCGLFGSSPGRVPDVTVLI